MHFSSFLCIALINVLCFLFSFIQHQLDLWWPGHVLLISQFNKYLLSTYMVPEFMYHTGALNFQELAFIKTESECLHEGEKMKRKHSFLASYLKNSWNSRSPLIRSEIVHTKDSVAKVEFFYHKHTSSQILSPWKLLTELWQKILLLLADKLLLFYI